MISTVMHSASNCNKKIIKHLCDFRSGQSLCSTEAKGCSSSEETVREDLGPPKQCLFSGDVVCLFQWAAFMADIYINVIAVKP